MFAFATCKWAIVDGKLHLHGRWVDFYERKWLGIRRSGKGFADINVLDASCNADDAACAATFGVLCRQTRVGEGFHHLGSNFAAVLADQPDVVAFFDGATEHFANAYTTNIVVPLDVGNQHGEGCLRIGFWLGDVFDDLVEQRRAIDALVVGMIHEVTIASGTIEERSIELLFGGIEVEEKFQYHVAHFQWRGKWTVDFVHHDDRSEAFLQSFAEHEASLCLGATGGVNDEQNAVDHFHHALYFSTEVGVAWGIDDIDGVAFPKNGGVFCLNGNAFFLLQVHGVHGALGDGLVLAISASGLQKLVNESGFAVVNVSDDGNVSNGTGHVYGYRKYLYSLTF